MDEHETREPAPPAGDPPAGELTIDELARAGGVVVSTVRLYQNRGLLDPPTKRGRVGYYGPPHLARLRLIGQLQERGFSLAGIKELVDGMERGESLRAVLGVGDAAGTWVPEEPRTIPLAELASHLPHVELTPELLRRVVDLGLVSIADGGTEVVVRSPSFLEVGGKLATMGVPGDAIIDQYELLRRDAETIAGRFTDLFRSHVWEPFVDDGMPAAHTAELIGALEELGPLAEGVVVMALRHALQDRAEAFVDAEARRLDIPIPRPGS